MAAGFHSNRDLQIREGSRLTSGINDYIVQKLLGNGSFAIVAKCVKLPTKKEVALRIVKVRSLHAARSENSMLHKLKSVNPDEKNIVRWNTSFMDMGHLCQEFELLDISLYEFVRLKPNWSLYIGEICIILDQLLTALECLDSLGIVHADLKPENIMMVDHVRQPLKVKVIDFGCAMEANTHQGAYIQTRWYRSPEVILGLPFWGAIDMWSLGCIAAELFLGYALFPGSCEYQMLQFMTKVLGPLPVRLLKDGLNRGKYCTENWFDEWRLKTPKEYGPVPYGYCAVKSLHDLKYKYKALEEQADVEGFVNLLELMLELDPMLRITPSKMRKHPLMAKKKTEQNMTQNDGKKKELPYIPICDKDVQSTLKAGPCTKEEHHGAQSNLKEGWSSYQKKDIEQPSTSKAGLTLFVQKRLDERWHKSLVNTKNFPHLESIGSSKCGSGSMDGQLMQRFTIDSHISTGPNGRDQSPQKRMYKYKKEKSSTVHTTPYRKRKRAGRETLRQFHRSSDCSPPKKKIKRMDQDTEAHYKEMPSTLKTGPCILEQVRPGKSSKNSMSSVTDPSSEEEHHGAQSNLKDSPSSDEMMDLCIPMKNLNIREDGYKKDTSSPVHSTARGTCRETSQEFHSRSQTATNFGKKETNNKKSVNTDKMIEHKRNIDDSHDRHCTMGKNKDERNSSNTSPSAKHSQAPNSLIDSSTQTDSSHYFPEVSDTLKSIDSKLTALDSRISLVELIHKDFQGLKQSLEFTQEQILPLTTENAQPSIQSFTSEVASLTKDNKHLKDTVLDLKSRSMRNNLIFTGIPEPVDHSFVDPEDTLKNFLTTQLKIPSHSVQQITFHSVHRLGPVKKDSKHPRPIIAKFEHLKQKELIKRQAKELKGMHFGVDDQYPREIVERRKVLFPILKEFRDNKRKAVIVVDKLYVDGQLFRDCNLTPWLY